MKIPDFIQKAMDGGMRDYWGGWKYFTETIDGIKFHDEEEYFPLCKGTKRSIEEIVLNPLAWQAVGKVSGWGDEIDNDEAFTEVFDEQKNKDVCQTKMHDMINALCWGKTIEQYLETL